MSETIGEMILPGTYIEVRAEGLIGVGGIVTGNVGVVGSANRGPLRTVQVLGSYTEALDTFGAPDAFPASPADQPKALTLTRALEQVFRGGASTVYAVRVASEGTTPMAFMSWSVTGAGDVKLFTLQATSPGTWANAIVARLSPTGTVRELTLELGRLKETFAGSTAKELAQAVRDGSRLVTVIGPSAADEAKPPTGIAVSAAPGGPDGVPLTIAQVTEGLGLLANQPVNIVVVAGVDAKSGAGAVLTHLEQTENDGRERIAIMGASTDEPATIIADDVSKGSNPRLVLVAPGIRAGTTALPASYAAALVAGRLAGLAPHVSLTNKDVPADDLTREYSRAQQKQLLGAQVLVLQKNLGIRVLKGITTDTGAFRQISVRRIVDHAKAGVRIGANPYIGRLNNPRVRAALKATLDGFLSSMILDEMLVAYQLDVTAKRSEEIAGQAIVTMVLQPTFSIDFVKVIMNLQ
jgi:hypothetical protein